MASDPRLPPSPFTPATAEQHGITRHTLRRLVRERRVLRITPGVLVAADVELTVDVRARAIGLVVPHHQVVADRTAAWIWGVRIFPYGDLDEPPIETVALRGNNACERAAVEGRVRDLAPDDYVTVGGVRVTTPLRTALDLACVLHRKDALAALDAFRREHGLSIGALTVGSKRYVGRRGVRQQRELIPLSDPRAESVRESWTRLAIVDAGLPVPDPQVWIEVDGVPTYRLDLAYRRRRVAIEYDGWEAHERTPEQKEHDEERRGWLRRNGWTIIVVRRGDFTGDELARWTAELREILRSSYTNRRWLERGDRAR